MGLEIISSAITSALKTVNLAELSKSLGYHNVDQFKQRLNAILATEFLCLDASHYDFHYSTPMFIQTLLKALNIESQEFTDALENAQKILSHKLYDQPEVRAVWCSESVPEPSKLNGFGRMALSNRLGIKVPFSVQNDETAFIEWLSKTIPQHYDALMAEFGRFGRVESYVYIKSPTEKFALDLSGNIISEVSNNDY